MKILITGGAGFIGTNLANELEGRHDVESIDIFTTSNDTNVSWPNHEVDIRNKEPTKQVITDLDPDVLIHAAAQTKVQQSVNDPVMDAETNILGTINVLDALEATGASKVIYFTTGGARYGDKQYLPISEDALPKPQAPYGISKYAAEHYVRYYAERNDWEQTSLGFSNVYGPYDTPKSGRVIPTFITQYLKGEAPTIHGDGEQTRDFLYVHDIVSVVQTIIHDEPPEEFYNLSTNTQTSINELATMLEDIIEPDVTADHGDGRSGGVRESQLDNTKAQEHFDFQPTPINEGLRKTVEWFKDTLA
jgi:UDP-glucose 4-epimerase